ncbi:MAG: hypothetical protein HN411_03980 [Waddliaceae bacterium]|jgi:hypothetical protein|nr:hypothetical protein [Waddliaceae bacterium]MBT3579196.1 hypothetical protein [Waddliaceae bacterium]MBT4444744.1 hypothetical protein [Waddliaceae bacterium]MBT6928896.1 hypothetical protein [Waddliaceae bacterium]MBT7264143.1 hypothetical protein [Waddliaceae bacterium]
MRIEAFRESVKDLSENKLRDRYLKIKESKEFRTESLIGLEAGLAVVTAIALKSFAVLSGTFAIVCALNVGVVIGVLLKNRADARKEKIIEDVLKDKGRQIEFKWDRFRILSGWSSQITDIQAQA